MSTYQPIDCGVHDRIELAILRRTRLQLVWTDADGTRHTATGMARDVVTRDGAEYLYFVTTTDEHAVRLDRIVSFDPA